VSPSKERLAKDREEYARVRSLSDEDIIRECMESHQRVVRELANRYDVVVEKLEQIPPGDAIAALEHVRASAQTGTYEGGVVISFAAFEAVRSALTKGEG